MPSSQLDFTSCPACLHQNVLLCLPHQATSVFHLLEPWVATTLLTIVAVANVLRTSHSHVLILTQPLELDSGSQHFALQKAVAAKVWSPHQTLQFALQKAVAVKAMSPLQTTLTTTLTTIRRQIRYRWRRD